MEVIKSIERKGLYLDLFLVKYRRAVLAFDFLLVYFQKLAASLQVPQRKQTLPFFVELW